MTPRPARLGVALLIALGAAPALAHHGTASVGGLGLEGPGAALDTASPLPLGWGTAFALVKSEYADFRQRSGFTDPKRFSSYNTLALGYGLRPWLSLFAFQPYSWKAQDGLGTNSGLGDCNLMLAIAFKWDEKLKLVPEKESLDELADWHFGLWVSSTIPIGSTDHVDRAGVPFAPDMQTGFRGPSPASGLTVLKQVGADLTFLVEASYQHFFAQTYPGAGLAYRFGGETRLGGALVWRAYAGGGRRLDLAAEASGLNLQRDQAGPMAAELQPMSASGGTVLYGLLGARASLGAVSVGLSVKRPLATRLNEAALQQGSEGLESFRAAVTLGYAVRP